MLSTLDVKSMCRLIAALLLVLCFSFECISDDSYSDSESHQSYRLFNTARIIIRGPGGCIREFHVSKRGKLSYVYGQSSEYEDTSYDIISIDDSGSVNVSTKTMQVMYKVIGRCAEEPSKAIGISVLDGFHSQLVVDSIICIDRYGGFGGNLDTILNEITRYKPLRFGPDCK